MKQLQQSLSNIAKHQNIAVEIALKEVERRARRILVQHPNLDEFVMGMGRAFFTYKIGARDSKQINLLPGKTEIIYDPFKYMRPVFKFIDEWDTDLHLTGAPMRFTAKGPIVTSW